MWDLKVQVSWGGVEFWMSEFLVHGWDRFKNVHLSLLIGFKYP